MPSSVFLKKGLKDGEWATIDVDVLPHVRKAVGLARKAGFLAATTDAQLALSGFHIGWELPGTYDVEARMKDLDVVAVK
jgi:hypothetical protein